jgi:hypothetical protein
MVISGSGESLQEMALIFKALRCHQIWQYRFYCLIAVASLRTKSLGFGFRNWNNIFAAAHFGGTSPRDEINRPNWLAHLRRASVRLIF